MFKSGSIGLEHNINAKKVNVGAIIVESVLIKWVLEESDRKFRSLQFCGEKDYIGL